MRDNGSGISRRGRLVWVAREHRHTEKTFRVFLSAVSVELTAEAEGADIVFENIFPEPGFSAVECSD